MKKIPLYRLFLKCAGPTYTILARYVSDTYRIRVSDRYDTGRIENPIRERIAGYAVSDRIRIGYKTYPCNYVDFAKFGDTAGFSNITTLDTFSTYATFAILAKNGKKRQNIQFCHFRQFRQFRQFCQIYLEK